MKRAKGYIYISTDGRYLTHYKASTQNGTEDVFTTTEDLDSATLFPNRISDKNYRLSEKSKKIIDTCTPLIAAEEKRMIIIPQAGYTITEEE